MNAEQSVQRIPIAVLTGFLGSGKTTVLRHLATRGRLERTLVLINEFGEVGLDHELLTRIDDDTLVAMNSGCICCSIRSDLAQTLATAPGRFARGGRRWFDRVIIETTGVADPAPILQTLLGEPSVAGRYDLARVLTTVDATNGAETIDAHEEALKQICVSDQVLLTKTDLVDDTSVAVLRRRLAELAPAARVSTIQGGAANPDWFFSGASWRASGRSAAVEDWLATEQLQANIEAHDHDHDHHDHDRNRHGRITASCLVFEEPVDARALDACLDNLLIFRGSDLLRVKGIVNVRGMDRPLVVHGVQHVFHPPEALEQWPSGDRRTRIVLITRDLDPELLRACFARFGLEAAPILMREPLQHA